MEDKGELLLLKKTFTEIIASYKKQVLRGVTLWIAESLDKEDFKEKNFHELIRHVKAEINIKPQRDRIIAELNQLADLKRLELRKHDHPRHWSVICPLCEKIWSTENKYTREQLEKDDVGFLDNGNSILLLCNECCATYYRENY